MQRLFQLVRNRQNHPVLAFIILAAFGFFGEKSFAQPSRLLHEKGDCLSVKPDRQSFATGGFQLDLRQDRCVLIATEVVQVHITKANPLRSIHFVRYREPLPTRDDVLWDEDTPDQMMYQPAGESMQRIPNTAMPQWVSEVIRTNASIFSWSPLAQSTRPGRDDPKARGRSARVM